MINMLSVMGTHQGHCLWIFVVCVVLTADAAWNFKRPGGCSENVAFHTKVLKSFDVKAQSFCSLACTQEADCKGYNYETEESANETRRCELVGLRSDVYGSYISHRQGYAYFEEVEDSYHGHQDTCSQYHEADCPEGWVHWRTSCYYFSTVEKNDNDARTHCRNFNLGAYPVAITTKDENDFIVDYISEHYDPSSISHGFTIGANDEYMERVWVWYGQGSSLESGYTNWESATAGPNHLDDNRNCAKLSTTDRWPGGYWHEFACNGQNSRFICEIDRRTNPTSFKVLDTMRTTYGNYDFLAVKVLLPEDGMCSSGDCCTEYKNLCSFLGPFSPTGCSRPHITTSSTEYLRCESDYNDDINIRDTLSCNPSSNIASLVNSAFGINSASGGTNGNTFGFHQCGVQKCVASLSGSAAALSYTAGAMSGDRVAYTACRENNATLCQCPSGYFLWRCSCYRFDTSLKTFAASRTACQADYPGSDIAVIEDSAENEMLKQTVRDNPSYTDNFWYIDGYDHNADNSGWQYISKRYRNWQFSDFQSSQPNSGGAQCVAFWPAYNWQWADENCGSSYHFICEIDMRNRPCRCPSG
ncbi:uncharacterized protein LOC106163219 [Lingula anatina]|uniref:Uncharacterized protein LOC106163219 n=2 Tax=Lingula anatina TaxID=7574 RepID=A0A1S3ID77_LINAN|nr:uncharacterized protein LOC106163219 [Lingula anatina]|eukprot:XP_013396192.1 uncharacterized protein LOC106163219 [Lingula anatina]